MIVWSKLHFIFYSYIRKCYFNKISKATFTNWIIILKKYFDLLTSSTVPIISIIMQLITNDTMYSIKPHCTTLAHLEFNSSVAPNWVACFITKLSQIWRCLLLRLSTGILLCVVVANAGSNDGSYGPPVNCAEVLCPVPLCLDGFELFTPDGSCCAQCRPIIRPPIDCSAVRCSRVECPPGQEPVNTPEKCCPVCRPIGMY